GVWIASVANIDWPSKPGLPAEEQKLEFTARLDQLKLLGCNAVIVQVRPAADALYASPYEPWSRFLTGAQGTPPSPYYDPLEFMIAETHKRNMEFHAWFNPFRALMDSHKNPNPSGHVTRTHPDWIIAYGGKSYLDPGNWQARDYVIGIIADVVQRYDIDGVHLDDYFYPYRVAGQSFNDQHSYNLYGQGTDREEWRRGNVDQFVAALSKKIKELKPWVKFGISPFGVWRNAAKDPDGSATRAGTTCFDDLYSNVTLWMKNGWLDYLMPQLYWEHGHKAAPFNTLLPWWNAHSYNRHMYYGLGVYRMWESPTAAWRTGDELLWQIRDIRLVCNNSGCCFYSASSFNKIRASVSDSLQQVYNKYPALPPTMKWIDSLPPASPTLMAVAGPAGNELEWKENNPRKEPITYVVYRFAEGEQVNIDRPQNIVTIVKATRFLDTTPRQKEKYTYVVTALDRLWNESKPSNGVALVRP
ncbi:MAG: hypothetical protein EBZ77_13160, partial [Chitinophagia bacterium]|nr:hypothetical protein [Chitinophagia bacterium]